MKKNIFGKKFKRDINERKALFKNLMSSLILEEKIKTTEQKAKAVKGELDKLVTIAKKDVLLARRLLGKKLNAKAAEKMIKDVAPRFNNRPGGYTKMVKLGRRFGDNASMVVLEWTETNANLKSQISNLDDGKAKNVKEKKSKTQKEIKKTPDKKAKPEKKSPG